ncbi:MAG: glycosyltransferase [archaeon]|nr:glycosyltransferase [archaeon]
MKVMIIGPLPPYRGGIAHSNYILCKNISKNNELIAISFSRLFPKTLYPGKFQETNNSGNKIMDFTVRRELDSINPLSWIKVFWIILKEKPDRVTFQWWHTFFTPAYFTIAILTKLLTKTKISMIIQNAVPHEKNPVHDFLTKIMFFPIDYFITLSNSDKKIILQMKKKADVNFLPEPAYSEYFGEEKNGKRKISNKIMFFGFVRKYKGLHFLLDAMPEIIKQNPKIKLMIVGEFWQDKNEYITKIKKLKLENKIDIVDRYVRDEEVYGFFSKTDAVVLPYVSSTQSGIIQMAIGFGTPVISTDVGGNKDLVKSGKNGLLVKPKDSNAIANAINEFYGKNLFEKFRKEMLKEREDLKWNMEKEKIFLKK